MKQLNNPVQMAVIGAAHGIKGEVRVKTFTGDPAALGDYGPLFAADGRRFDVQSVRPQGEVAVVRLKGVNDRNAAEALNGTALFVERENLPDTADDDEFYHADLVGLVVRDAAGAEIGRVKAVLNYGGGDILEIALGGREDRMIPFSKAAVPAVDVRGGFVTIDPIAAGLVDDEDDDAVPGQPQRFNATCRPRGPADAGGNR
ncbi:MAG TPA: ribosome maturation factor RimM [Rhizobiaceae bacterium]|nr:ribosome maturation factor RimM [Rhizobiaceae bacterium]